MRPISDHPARLPDARRLIDEGECVASVLLAIVFAHQIGAANVSWAAFSGYMVMRGHVAESLVRGVLRIIGTAVGALIGLLVTPLVASNGWLAGLALSLIGGSTLYGALTGRRAYAWLFVGLTFVMILLDKMEHPATSLWSFAVTRMLETVAGTVACVLVSAVSTLTLRRYWPAKRSPAAAGTGWHPHAARHAAQAASALAILPSLGAVFHVPALAQSAVTIIAVMLVPVSSIGASGFAPVSRRLIQRVIGCLAGAALAAFFLFTAHGWPPMLIAGTMLGVAAGRHLENGQGKLGYAGTQFVLAILVTLVPDSYSDVDLGPALDRLMGILIGMALLEPVLFLWHVFTPAELPASGGADHEAGGV
jgi:uncharacterized membrane protein YccC